MKVVDNEWQDAIESLPLSEMTACEVIDALDSAKDEKRKLMTNLGVKGNETPNV